MEAEAKPNLQASSFSESEQAELESRSTCDGQEILREVKQQVNLPVVTMMFVGHLGELQLSAAALSTSFTSVTFTSILIGMSSGLEKLSGKIFGAKQFNTIEKQFQRALLVHLLLCISLAIICIFTGDILKLLGQDPLLSAEAGAYARVTVSSLFPFAFLQCIIRFLQTEKDVIPVISAGTMAILHIPICYLMVFKTGLGYKGAPLAITTSLWIHVGLLAIYIGKSDTTKRTWTGFSKHPFHDVPNYLGLAVPSTVMPCLNIYIMVSMIPVGLSGAVSTRVSDELGAAQPHAARTSAFAAVLIVAAEGILAAIAMIVMHNVLGYCYRKEHKVVKHVGQMVFLTAGAQFIDGIPMVLSGVARGCGWQKIVTCVNLGAYFAVGIPCGLLLAFYYHLVVKGLLTGIIVALLIKLLAFIIITLRINWENQAKMVSDQAQDSMEHKFDDLLLNNPQVPQTVNPA
ncbi:DETOXIFICATION 16-like protein [Drosera capensis]